jgi:CDP-diacylglycerol--glycerol-3-phosphate 3-phosphatidyltransferase
MWYNQLSLSNQLTLIRLIGSPLVLPFFLVYLLPLNILWLNCTLAALFLLFGFTDFLDGYFARRHNSTSRLGAMLDPIADKFLLYSVLISLVAVHKLYFFWAIVWIGREFFIMALRQISLEHNFSVEVSSYGKLKTVFQIACLAVIIANPYCGCSFDNSWWNSSELVLLITATILSVLSAYDYCLIFMQKFFLEK